MLSGGIQTDEQVARKGGFSDVFKGTWNGRDVAIKSLHKLNKAGGTTKTVSKAFWREVVTWRRLSHPNILPFFGVLKHNEGANNEARLAMVAPWMSRGHLIQYLRQFPSANRVQLLVDIGEGLRYLHSMSILHGDLKSRNTLVDDMGRACLGDFGLSDVQGYDSPYGSGTEPLRGGSLRWMAPELLEDDQQYRSVSSDVYAFGMVMFEAFSGLPPFTELRDEVAIISLIKSGNTPTRPPDTTPQLSDEIWSIIESCWSYVPRNRPSVTYLLHVLSNALNASSIVDSGEQRRVPSTPGVTQSWTDIDRVYMVGELDDSISCCCLNLSKDRE
ncbi:hypothetical protein JAAARDRAFT_137090 [Jaapia argillacea MUCL 33604]|uniref:Protein kinase domain-containing protein n=1 Tax=Jaapia argillacea MUCL 33604 TaxID=933084 RepID=A0A067PFF0_9AGAM|nr:hypothetical protein JAAARDRAFT_137090 [Jaapia argillacea MUCL 33604]